MNVLVLTSTFPRWHNDTTPLFVYELSRRLGNHGIHPSILAPHDRGAATFEVWEGMKIYRYRYLPPCWETLAYRGGILPNLKDNRGGYFKIPFFLAAQLVAIGKVVRKEKIDCLHAHWLFPQGFMAALYKKFFNPRMPVLCTSHGSDITTLHGGLMRWCKRFALSHINALTTVSKELKRQVEALAGGTSIDVIPMGIDVENFTAARKQESIRKEYGVDGPLLLFVGRLAEEKGIHLLLEALAGVAARIPSIKLLIVGSGPLEKKLKELTARLDLNGHVIFTGHVQNKDLAPYYASADVLISPSLREGMPVVLLEAMSCACCVLASDLPTLREIIVDGKTGFSFSPGDPQALARKLNMILQNSELRQHVALQAKDMVQKTFPWERIAQQYADKLRNI